MNTILCLTKVALCLGSAVTSGYSKHNKDVSGYRLYEGRGFYVEDLGKTTKTKPDTKTKKEPKGRSRG